MKKTTLLSALCLFMLAHISTAQAQTKEETIAWIKEKIEKYLPGAGFKVEKIVDINISPCRLTYSWTEKDHNPRYTNAYILYEKSFPITSIVSIEGGHRHVEIKFDARVVQTKTYSIYGRLTEYNHLKTTYSSTANPVTNAESDLGKRMEKALKHLATFCEEKKEAF